MKEIVVISGKGGTGKTSIMSSLAYLAADKAVIADCDVDAANVHLILKPDILQKEDFYSGLFAEIDHDKCIDCGLCKDYCRFDAIHNIDRKYEVDKISCEGCGFCMHICPTKALTMKPQRAGEWMLSDTRIGTKLVHAKLGIGAENSGKLVAKVKNEAKLVARKEKKEYVIVDGSPGIGCPVVSSISGADFVVYVTEPTVSAVHDLKRVVALVKKFKIPSACIINKFDINEKQVQEIKNFLKEKNIPLLTELPYDEKFTKAMVEGKTIIEMDNSSISNGVKKSWQKIKKLINN